MSRLTNLPSLTRATAQIAKLLQKIELLAGEWM